VFFFVLLIIIVQRLTCHVSVIRMMNRRHKIVVDSDKALVRSSRKTNLLVIA